MTAAERVAVALGGSLRSGEWQRCPCPVHVSSGASLALRDAQGGLIVHCHAGCRRRDILAELRRRGLLNGASGASSLDPAEKEFRREAEARDWNRRIDLARDIIASALSAPDTPVERYLRMRGITILPPAIRYLPMGDPYARHSSGSRRPVMVAAVEHVAHGIVGAHRTWLARDGSGKASLDPVRISIGPIGGGAVRLAAENDTLMVGEGIETCLAAMTATGAPVWAALSTSGLTNLVLPLIVRNIVILADNDVNGAGKRAAYVAARRWMTEGRAVRIAMPRKPGTDFNDVLLGRPCGGASQVHHAAA